MITRSRGVLKDGAVSTEALRSCMAEHAAQVMRMEKLRDYYEGRHAIDARRRASGLPNNRLSHGFPHYISTMAAGYLIGDPVRYAAEEGTQTAALREILRAYERCAIDSVDAELARDASIFGKGVELLFADEQAVPRAAALDPCSAFVVYDDTVAARPLFGVRYGAVRRADGSAWGSRVDVYTERERRGYFVRGMEKLDAQTPDEIEGHFFGGVPLVEYSVTSFASGFTAYSEERRPKLTRVGKLVQLTGSCKPTKSIAGGDAEPVMFTIPREYWPEQEIFQICQGSGRSVWMLKVTPSGEAVFARYRTGDAWASAGTNTWLPFHAVWLASDYTGAVVVQRPQKALTANSSQDCVASASTVYGSSYPAWRAFDFKETTGWASLASDGAAWLGLQMDVALKNIAVSVYARDTAYVENPTAGKILGSNDGVTWAEIGSFSGWNAAQSSGLLGTVECGNETAYSRVRLSVTGRSHASRYVAVGYMTVRGELPE